MNYKHCIVMILAFVFMLLFPVGSSFGVELVWDASTGIVNGYRVFYTDGTNNWSKDVGNTTSVNIDDLYLDVGVEYSFEVRAYNAVGHSPPSNIVTYTRYDLVIPPEKTALGQVAGAPIEAGMQ